jgi:hypothetical protein
VHASPLDMSLPVQNTRASVVSTYGHISCIILSDEKQGAETLLGMEADQHRMEALNVA